MHTRPSLGLHLLVKNGESVVRRLVDCVGPYVREVVAVLNDCEDATEAVLRKACRVHDVGLKLFYVTDLSWPGFYTLDVPATYEVGRSLCGERVDVEYTGRPILADWAGARNVGWESGSTEWKLMLDADDVVDDPECLPQLVSDLDQGGVQAAASRYVHSAGGGVPSTVCTRERLARNISAIRWTGRVHERLTGYDPKLVGMVADQLVVRDLRDSRGAGIRIPGRNFKILYLDARLSDWHLSQRHLVLLAAEARQYAPALTVALAEFYFSEVAKGNFSGVSEEAAWVACQAGEVYELDDSLEKASEWYQRAVSSYQSPAAYFRLARCHHELGNHATAAAAYERGVACSGPSQRVEGGEGLRREVLPLVVRSLVRLGRYREASGKCEQALQTRPEDQELLRLRAEISEKLGEEKR
jgi:tetratricopeptide (TPR) repeat protein